MERQIQADNAFIKWMEAMSKNVVHIANAWYAAVKWADQHPNWISVEKVPFPPKKNKWDKISEEVLIYGILPSGQYNKFLGSYHYDINEWGVKGFMTKITHWMEIVPPQRKEE